MSALSFCSKESEPELIRGMQMVVIAFLASPEMCPRKADASVKSKRKWINWYGRRAVFVWIFRQTKRRLTGWTLET